MHMTPTMNIVTAGDIVDRLAGLSVDELRALDGRLEDAQRVTRAILRERLALARRNDAWRARELSIVTKQ
jgi:hypothetical protein